MIRLTFLFTLLLAGLVPVACGAAGDGATPSGQTQPGAVETGADNQAAPPPAAGNGFTGLGSSDEVFDRWLAQVRDGTVAGDDLEEARRRQEPFQWALGYLTYYGSIEMIGLDNLIYNALRVHRRLATGEVTPATLTPNEQNLLDITGGIQHSRDLSLEQQIGQTAAVRAAILERITQDQSRLSPTEALAANEVAGLIGTRSPLELGGKYLVYYQESPEADFQFVGVVMVADVAEQQGAIAASETYSHGPWQRLPWLADAAGPFWEQIPTGASGDPTNINEGKPGVLLVSEEQWEVIREQ
jgi:hypothetical protein